MNREIIEAIKQIEREKGIDSETLLVALEDALLAAYRKTPGSVEWARVDIDRETGGMQVSQLVLAEGVELVTLPRPEPMGALPNCRRGPDQLPAAPPCAAANAAAAAAAAVGVSCRGRGLLAPPPAPGPLQL